MFCTACLGYPPPEPNETGLVVIVVLLFAAMAWGLWKAFKND